MPDLGRPVKWPASPQRPGKVREPRCRVNRCAELLRAKGRSEYRGIALLRLPRKPTPRDPADAVSTLAEGLERDRIDGRLWVIQRGRIRVYQEERKDLD